MGWLSSIVGARRRREARRALASQVRSLLAERGPAAAWAVLESGLRADADPGGELFHLAAHVLRLGGERSTAELFDRAADAPHDPQRLFELGSELLTAEQPEAAASVLERALAFVPFDAVVRSELAIAHARAGRPERVLETLALHPCLGDDPGALFQFGWASLLAFDLRAAEGALAELSGAPSLASKLRHAIERARAGTASDPPDARDFFFIEHGGVLLDAGGPLGGRYDTLPAGAAWTDAIVARAGDVLAALVPAPRRVVILDAAHDSLAHAVARACGAEPIAPGRGRVPSVILPLFRADRMDALGRESFEPGGPVVFALTMDFGRAHPRAPHLVGAFARTLAEESSSPALAPSAELAAFVEARRAHLSEPSARPRSAYVPDEPLPR